MPRLPQWWLTDGWPARLLAPMGWLFSVLVTLRRRAYRSGLLNSQRLSAPVLVVGNIFVGGTGKTPLVALLSAMLQARGWRPGIICRGYGGRAEQWPQRVHADSRAADVGDEPVLLARRSGAPVWAGPDRVAAGRELLATCGCDVVILDDGLQHYRLQRDREIVVMDGARRLGNGRCLPAGPLREPVGRLAGVDLVLYGNPLAAAEPGFELKGATLHAVDGSARSLELADLAGQRVHGVAGIGHPERFFERLTRAGLEVSRHAFADHHPFSVTDLERLWDRPVVMTEKDAVKCAAFAGEQVWYLAVEAQLNAAGEAAVKALLDGLEELVGEGS